LRTLNSIWSMRHVARAFDHHLHVVLPGAAGEFAEGLELGELRLVGGVVQTSRAQRVAEREGARRSACKISQMSSKRV
jgi:hypothetical protein